MSYFEAPVCTYCHQMYSRLNEPILIVCLCDQVAKFAHGSCFRRFLQNFSFGVCDTCFTKTKILPDGYKPVTQWKFEWKPLCGFWRRFKTSNRYWKVVYCREIDNGKSQKTIRYEDVPFETPWKNDPVQETENEEGSEIAIEITGIQEKVAKRETGSDCEEEDKPDARFSIPVVFKPRGYPYVKRSRSEDHLSPTLDPNFEYYHTLTSSNRSSINSFSQRGYYNDANSIYTVETNDSLNSDSNDNDDVNSDIRQHREQLPHKESKFRSLGRQFLKRFNNSETVNDNNTHGDSKRKSSNNNTYTVTRVQSEGNIAVLPLENDIIYMHNTEISHTSSMSRDLRPEDNWTKKDVIFTISDQEKKNSNKKNKKNGETSTQFYGVSTMTKPVIELTPEPKMNILQNTQSVTGLIEEETRHGMFYIP